MAAVLLVDVVVLLALAHGEAAALVASAGLLVPFALLMTGLRTVLGSRGLRRCLPGRFGQPVALATGALCVAAANAALLGGLAWGLLVPGAVGSPSDTVVLLWGGVATALAGALRLAGTSHPDFGTGLVMTDAGPVPAGALLTALTGPDAVVAQLALLALGAPPWLVLALALAACARELRRMPC